MLGHKQQKEQQGDYKQVQLNHYGKQSSEKGLRVKHRLRKLEDKTLSTKMVRNTDPSNCMITLETSMIGSWSMETVEQPWFDEEMDTIVPTITMPPADLDTMDPLFNGDLMQNLEIMETTEDIDTKSLMDTSDEYQIDEYNEDDYIMVEIS
ncbi:hypothetical protein ACLKA7_006635 [Drosophila subpalustris]